MSESQDILPGVPLQDVLWRLAPPLDSLGEFEWVSGLALLNVDEETYKRVGSNGAGTEDDEELVRTLTHEVTHFHQVLLFGYLYRWVWRLTATVMRCAAREQPLTSTADATADWAAVVRTVGDAGADASTDDLRSVRACMADLEREDETGISPLAIAEGHATFVELRRAFETNGIGYATLLDKVGCPPLYRRSFDVLRDRLGVEAARSVLPLVSSLALCSSEPTLSFRLLTDEVERSLGRGENELDIDDLTRRCCGITYVDTPVLSDDVPELTERYAGALAAVRAEVHAGRFDPYRYFSDPRERTDALAAIAHPIQVLLPRIEGQIPIMRGLPEIEPRASVGPLLSAAITRSVFEAVAARVRDADVAEVWETPSEQIRAARDRNRGAMFNLGVLSFKAGEERTARLWWRLAAVYGDGEAARALCLLLARDDPAGKDADWFSRTIEALTRPASARQCLEYADAVRNTDTELAAHWYGQAARADSIDGAFQAGMLMRDEDPGLALYYLAQVAGNPGLDPELAMRADTTVKALQKRFGRRGWRECRQRAMSLFQADG